MATYQEMLEQAKLRKQGQVPPSPPASRPSAPPKKAVQNSTPISNAPKPRKINADGLPFDDKIYAHMKFALEKLSGRLKSKTALTQEELAKLEEAITAIKNDAIGEDFASNSQDKASPQGTLSSSNGSGKLLGSFENFRGQSSTWEVPGMEKMSVEQYYQALNQRLAGVRNKLKEEGLIGPTAGNYIDSLSQKRK